MKGNNNNNKSNLQKTKSTDISHEEEFIGVFMTTKGDPKDAKTVSDALMTFSDRKREHKMTLSILNNKLKNKVDFVTAKVDSNKYVLMVTDDVNLIGKVSKYAKQEVIQIF